MEVLVEKIIEDALDTVQKTGTGLDGKVVVLRQSKKLFEAEQTAEAVHTQSQKKPATPSDKKMFAVQIFQGLTKSWKQVLAQGGSHDENN